jgi:uncharacterized protein YecT (DUF1311 family)
MKSFLIGICAALTCAAALAQRPSEFADADAKLNACIARDSSNTHIRACNSAAQAFADARLNSVYQAWTEALRTTPKFLSASSQRNGLDRFQEQGLQLAEHVRARRYGRAERALGLRVRNDEGARAVAGIRP